MADKSWVLFLVLFLLLNEITDAKEEVSHLEFGLQSQLAGVQMLALPFSS